jgi:hypothetical protein
MQPPRVSLHPFTLQLAPPVMDARFWEWGSGQCCAFDRWALLLALANVYITSSAALAVGAAATRTLLLAGCAAMAALTLAARTWLAAWPAQYLRYRGQQMLLQRAVRILYLLVRGTQPAWGRCTRGGGCGRRGGWLLRTGPVAGRGMLGSFGRQGARCALRG